MSSSLSETFIFFQNCFQRIEIRRYFVCVGFPGYCSESFPGQSCNVVCDFGRNNVPLCQVRSFTTKENQKVVITLLGFEYQSNEGPLSQFSTFVYRGSSHRRKSDACPKFDMVWQYRSPIPVVRRGLFPRSNDFYLPSLRVDRGGGGRHPVGRILNFKSCS